MTSENKKRKAKNSYITNGGKKYDAKWKRFLYFRKRDRVKNKRINEDDINEDDKD